MTIQFQFTPRAVNDLDAIWWHIAQDSVRAANRVESAILSACASLASRPLQAPKRPQLTKLPLRFWTISRYPNFLVVYRPDKKPLRVVAVLHGRRDIRSLLTEIAADETSEP